MELESNFDEEALIKTINNHMKELNEKFKIYDKIIYEENPHKIINPYYKIRLNEKTTKEINMDRINEQIESKQKFFEGKLAKLKNMIVERDNIIKGLREDLDLTEKKYYDTVKEKDALKSIINLNSKNLSLGKNMPIDFSNPFQNFNTINKDIDPILKPSHINYQINNNNCNIFSNYKNSSIGMTSRNKMIPPNPYLKVKKNDDSDDNMMNMTIDVNSKISNFAMFNNNLTTRNAKKNLNNVSKAETIIYDEQTFRKEYMNNHVNLDMTYNQINPNLNNTKKINKDKEFFEKQIVNLNTKLEKLTKENEETVNKNKNLVEENNLLKEKLDLLNSKYQILLKEKDANKLLLESIANINNIQNNQSKKNSNKNENSPQKELNLKETQEEKTNYASLDGNSGQKEKILNTESNIRNSDYSSYNPNISSNYSSNFTNTSGNQRNSIKENSVDTRLSKYDIKSNMKRRSSVQSHQVNNNNDNKQIKNNLTTVNNNLKTQNYNSNNINNTSFNSNLINDSPGVQILSRNENKRFSEMPSGLNSRFANNNKKNIANVNVNLGSSNVPTFKQDNRTENTNNQKKEPGLLNKLSNFFSKNK